MQGYEIILKTGRIYEFEMACNALGEAGIPYVKQEESYTGIKTGYVQRVMGPGCFFNLLVPATQKEQATKVISELPIEVTTEPDIWHYGANEKSKRNWKTYALIVLGILAVGLAITLFDLINK